ncbi:uncharacterized protein J7T54_007613 [Emericellopsis cladophorae]|uniref:Mannose-6-phosphate isomerase n=1 Tax=Emericellopsis cladophorae TaxID=2686198 RepID=A0A9Q0BAW7_9HYPO|nr:uncharacterized protein J7T54_007613 [Emericellopsis cladophorae]KAI6778672.1 hypothetical protein J7T54_007613 [Emericellopsis cladophorae]
MTTPLRPFYQLKCGCNSYPWGKQGKSSLSGHLCAQTPGYAPDDNAPKTPFQAKEDEAYAEMWMGTYPTLPSYVADTDEKLQAVLDRHPNELLGKAVVDKFGHTQLPFLPKILSISKALPLQIHPNKEFSTKMHNENPDAFGDPNHKPEIALALTEFEAFVGFKPLDAVASLLDLPELAHLRTSGNASRSAFTNEDLRAVVRDILNASPETCRDTYKVITSMPSGACAGPHNGHVQKLAPRLADQYSSADPGLLVALLTMNYLVLQPGEAVYIPADGIHAYLSGDIVECMARSDNVLNTGFCPRAERDNIEQFCSLLTFTPHDKMQCMLPATRYWRSEKGRTRAYAPPLSEFNVLATTLGKDEDEVLGKGGAGIVIATRGSGRVHVDDRDGFDLKEGHVYFVGQGVKLSIKAGGDGLTMHTAYVE